MIKRMVVTFLPYPDFTKSIQSLDDQRLGKQRVEAKQLISALRNGGSLLKHPACKMWEGYIPALEHYYNTCLDEWERRGFKNNIERICIQDIIIYPWFLNWEPFHKSHQASLYRKHPAFYKDKFQIEEFYLNKGYIWPSHHEEKKDIIVKYTIDDPQLISLFHPVNTSTIRSSSESKKRMYTVPMLKGMAKEKSIKGYYKMNKPQLLEILGIDIS